MEEDIKILKEFTESSCCLASQEEIIECVKNLIKGYRELEYKYNKALTDLSIEAKRTNEENYRCSLFAVENNDLKEKLADSIPKSKIKEKIEEIQEQMRCEDNEKVLVWLYKQLKVLHELMEE